MAKLNVPKAKVQRIDHDGLFKELLRHCFVQFIEAFLPEVILYLDTDSIVFVEPESHSRVVKNARRAPDVVVEARFKGEKTYFLIHTEAQAHKWNWSPQRMFEYFAILSYERKLPVYPIALLSWQSPKEQDAGKYVITFPDRQVLEFSYVVIQLNRLKWRDYLRHDNAAVSALMAKMNVASAERPLVKAACLGMLARLRLRGRKAELIHRFVDTYLPLTKPQEVEFQREVKSFAPKERKEVMFHLTSWERKGVEIGKLEAKLGATLKLLDHQIGQLSKATQKRIGALSLEKLDELFDAAFRFSGKDELNEWLDQQAAVTTSSKRKKVSAV